MRVESVIQERPGEEVQFVELPEQFNRDSAAKLLQPIVPENASQIEAPSATVCI